MGAANIHDVAALAGVSSATVSRALRGLSTVAPQTRERIEAAADELAYHINRQASGLASGRTMSIGLVAPWLGTWYTSQVIVGAERVLVDAGYDLLVASVPASTLDPFLDRAAAFGRSVDGTLLIDVYVEGDDRDRLGALEGPVVSLGEAINSYPSVVIDNVAAAELATRHLLDLGHRRVGLVRGAEPNGFSSPVRKRRELGWRAAHTAAGVPVDEALVADGDDQPEGGREALHRLMSLHRPPTAIFSTSDHMAFGLLAAASERGLSVPADLSVVGFDDHPLANAFGLTTMRQDIVEMASAAATALLAIVDGRSIPPLEANQPVELVIRRTTGPPSSDRR